MLVRVYHSTLLLYGNRLTSLSATQFAGLTSLFRLELFDNRLASLSPTQFDGLTSLLRLHLQGNRLASLSATQFDGLTSLTYVAISLSSPSHASTHT